MVNTHIFKDAFESISRIVDEIIIEVDSEGFRVNALDRSHITFVGLNLEASVFDEFVCDIPERICLDTIEFMKILKRGKKDDVLQLSIEEGNLVLKFIGESTRKFKIRLIDLDYNVPELPNLNPPCSIQVLSGLMKDCLADMELFGDVLKYTIDEDYFIANSDGEFGDSAFKYLHGEDINESVSSNFSIDKLKDIFSASKFSDICELYLGNNMPIIIIFRLDTGDGELKFLLAPRLTEED